MFIINMCEEKEPILKRLDNSFDASVIVFTLIWSALRLIPVEYILWRKILVPIMTVFLLQYVTMMIVTVIKRGLKNIKWYYYAFFICAVIISIGVIAEWPKSLAIAY